MSKYLLPNIEQIAIINPNVIIMFSIVLNWNNPIFFAARMHPECIRYTGNVCWPKEVINGIFLSGIMACRKKIPITAISIIISLVWNWYPNFS